MADSELWLTAIVPLHRRLTDVAVELTRSLLIQNKIDFLSVTGRTKCIETINQKIKRKNYKSPQVQVTDITGIIVITFLESQVEQISLLVKYAFNIDEANSMDRSEVLGSERMGYRSVHFVCTLGEDRKQLLEYRDIAALKFEIQVRTVLQHAWAELAHDRSFKFSPGLPQPIQRRLNLYSGMLEVVDAGFDSISKEIDEYTRTIQSLSNVENDGRDIDRLTLQKFVLAVSEKHDLHFRDQDILSPMEDVIAELNDFGARKIGDISKLLTTEFLDEYRYRQENSTSIGFLRDLLMYSDIEKYFRSPLRWGATTDKSSEILYKKWGKKKVRNLFKTHDIELQDDEDSASDEGSGIEF